MNWHTHRRLLAARAKSRRLSLGLNAKFLSSSLDVAYPTISSWEEALPINLSPEKQVLWEGALRVQPGWLLSKDMVAPEVSPPDGFADTASQEIEKVGAWLSRSAQGRRTVDLDQLNDREKRYVSIFKRRYGVNGCDVSTLQSIGDSYGLTRERVRQIVERMLGRVDRNTPPRTPHLLRIKDLIATKKIQSVSQFDRDHRDLLGEQLSVSDANIFCQDILGFELFNPTKVKNVFNGVTFGEVIGDAQALNVIQRARSLSLQMIRYCGAANMAHVVGSTLLEHDSIDGKSVRNALINIEGFEWLDDSNSWFWFGPNLDRNHALRVASKIFSVPGVTRVDIEDLHHALCRYRRHASQERGEIIPLEVSKFTLYEIYIRTPWLKCIQFNDFALRDANVDSDYKTPTSDGENLVIQTILDSGGCASRKSIITALGDKISSMNLQFILVFSPTIRNLGSGIFGVTGRGFSGFDYDIQLNGMWGSNRKPGAVQRRGDGLVDVLWDVTDYQLRNSISMLPSSAQNSLALGNYKVQGIASGEIKICVSDNSVRANGLTPLMKRAGFVSPDQFLLQFNTVSMVCEIAKPAILSEGDGL